jgi:hypothetical protein
MAPNQLVIRAAATYLDCGWQPVPVRFRTKQPMVPNWPSFRPDRDALGQHFGGELVNVGVLLGEPSGGLVDVDLDCPEALDLAPRLLPPTTSVFGRPGRPASHRLYFADDAVTARYNEPATADTRSTTLVELRSTGCQTVFPPSVHPSGEPITWDGAELATPARVAAAGLSAAVARLAAAVLLVRRGWAADDACRFVLGDVAAPAQPDPETIAAVNGWIGTARAPMPTFGRAAASSFSEAAARYNADYGRPWPRNGGSCPACGHHGCFGRLPGDESRWACFSAGHQAVGIRGASCWHGDALDLDAHAAGMAPTELLRNAGYLVAEPAPAAPQGAGDPGDRGGGPACAEAGGREGASAEAPAASARELPTIDVANCQFRDLVPKAWAALMAWNEPPRLFRRLGRLVRLARHRDVATLEALDEVTLFGLLARTATWVRTTKEKVKQAKPDKDVARDMIALPTNRLPPITDVVTFPVFAPDGELIASPGYHRAAELWLHIDEALCPTDVPDEPTGAEIGAARRLIVDELLGDFPLASDADRAHAVAALLQPIVRPMIAGPTPLYLIESPTPGTGKSLLARVVSQATTGSEAAAMTVGRDEEEVRKRITSVLAGSGATILVDNIRHGLHSSQLAAALTANIWSDRLLGGSAMVNLLNRALWMATGNNVDLSLEIARRCVRIRLDSGSERPWAGRRFRHANLPGWVANSRAELLRAMLILVRAWLAAGRPAGARSLGSFETWASMLGGILECVGITGFLSNVGDLHEAADAETREWRVFVVAWSRALGDGWTRVGRLVQLADDEDLLGGILGKDSTRSKQVRLGKALAHLRDRVLDGLKVETRTNAHTKAAEYRLVAAQEVVTGGAAQCPGDRPFVPTEPGGGNGAAGSRDTGSRTALDGSGEGSDGPRDVAGCPDHLSSIEREMPASAGNAGGSPEVRFAVPAADQRGAMGSTDVLRDVAGSPSPSVDDVFPETVGRATQGNSAPGTWGPARGTSRTFPQDAHPFDFTAGSPAEFDDAEAIPRSADPATPRADADDLTAWEEGLL